MKNTITFFVAILVFIAFTSLTVNRTDKQKKFNIEDAVKSGLFKAEVKGLGGHSGECISINVINNSPTDTIIYIEPGRRFISLDTNVQDILIVRELPLLVRAGEEKKVSLFGFCCQATNAGPDKDEKFTIGQMADSQLVKLAVFLNQNPYDEYTIQNAVWVVSDNHALASVHSSNISKRKELRKLHQFLAVLKNLPVEFSWYTLTYKTDTTRLFSGVADSLYGDFDYSLWKNCAASLTLNDSQGRVIKRFFVEKSHNPNTYNYEIKMSVASLPKGKYFVRLIADNQMKSEKVFEL